MQDSKSSATESSSASLSIMSAISSLKFPFKLTKDQIEAVDAWTTNGYRGSIIYMPNTGPAEMFLIFCLGRLDVLPVTDLGIRKAMQKTYSLSELPKPAEMLSIAQPWKPYRTVATWYLWKSLKFDSIG